MPECICIEHCYINRRYRPGNIAFFSQVPPHFVELSKYHAEQKKENEDRARPDASVLELQAMVKELTAKNKKLATENTDLRKKTKAAVKPDVKQD